MTCWTHYCSFLLFFFSSRRRHTRSKRDWSSDVCSSDLSTWNPTWDDVLNKPSVFNPVIGETSTTAFRGDYGKIAYEHSQLNHARSEERRVGKECRSRWWG